MSVAAVLLVAFVCAPGARADAVALKLDVVPATISLEPTQSMPVLVVVRNGGAGEATNVRLSWLDAPQISVTPTKASTTRRFTRLPAGAERAWQLDVSEQPTAHEQKLYFRVDYIAGGIPHIAIAALDVANVAPEKVEDIATVDVKTTLESLDSANPGVVYLVVTNKLATPLAIKSVDATGPDFVEFTTPKLPSIGAGQQVPLRVDVKAKGRVRPGKYLLLFNLQLGWDDGHSGSVITTQQAQIGIVGENAVLTVLGVPTFLLLPGFLIMLAIATLWRFGILLPAGPPAQPPFDFTKPDFWVLAVTASIVTGVVYPLVSGVDYLRGAYGLTDVVVIWIVSLALGVLIWLVIAGTLWMRHRLRTPTDDDDGATTLERLARRGLGSVLPRYTFGTAPDTYTGFVLQRDGEASKFWFAPQINVEVKPEAAGRAPLLNELQTENDPKRLAKLIKKRRSDLDISWEYEHGPDHPYPKSAEDMKSAQPQPEDRVVRAS